MYSANNNNKNYVSTYKKEHGITDDTYTDCYNKEWVYALAQSVPKIKDQEIQIIR